MTSGNPGLSSLRCPYFESQAQGPEHSTSGADPNSHPIVRKGFYRRSSDCRRIARYYCKRCRRSFSRARFSPCSYQKKRKLNEPLRRLLCSGVSQRRAARLLGINRKTVVRKLLFLASQAQAAQRRFLGTLSGPGQQVLLAQFDEMESFERSKCLPLSIPLAVQAGTRKILAYRVCSMPAKGPLAAISLKKYGPRADDRAQAAADLFTELKAVLHPEVLLTTDQNPKYPGWIRPHFPRAEHRAVKGRRGCVVGQGELKRIGMDPLFDLNHSCAMLRANVNRLFRRTWCTTKRADRLAAHLALYVQYHNEELT